MSRIETMNGLQVSRTRKRLRVSRLFGLGILALPLFGAFGHEIAAAGGFLLLIGIFAILDSLHAADLLPTGFLIP